MKEVKKSIWKIVHAVVLFFAMQLLGGIIAALFYGIYSACNGVSIQLQMSNILAGGMFLGDLLAIWVFLKRRWTTIHWGSVPSADRLSVVLVVVVFTLGIIIPSGYITEWTKLEDYFADGLADMMHHPIGILSITIVGPIVEEIICRGVILTILLKLFRKPWSAIVVSALLFGIIHMNPVQIFFATLLGIVLGWLYYRTGSLVPSIVMHIVNNSVSTALSLTLGYSFTLTGGDISTGMLVVMGVVSVAISVAAFYWLNRRFDNYEPLAMESVSASGIEREDEISVEKNG